jgi:hypothetical protein
MSLRLPVLALMLALLVTPASASADLFDDLYEEYRTTNVINGCRYDAGDLREALAGVPPDISAYDPGFTDTLNAALEQRASGCDGSAVLSLQLPPPAGAIEAGDGSPGPGPAEPLVALPHPDPSSPDRRPAGVLAAGLGVLACAGAAVAAVAGRRRRASDQP